MAPSGMYYEDTVGAFGVVSAGQNRGRLASAVRRWSLKLPRGGGRLCLTFPDGAILLTENEVFGEASLAFIFPINHWVPVKWGKVPGQWRSNMVRFSLNIPRGKCGIFEVKRRFALSQLRILRKAPEPSKNQVRPVSGPLKWASQTRPWLRPFFGKSLRIFRKQKAPVETGKKSPTTS